MDEEFEFQVMFDAEVLWESDYDMTLISEYSAVVPLERWQSGSDVEYDGRADLNVSTDQLPGRCSGNFEPISEREIKFHFYQDLSAWVEQMSCSEISDPPVVVNLIELLAEPSKRISNYQCPDDPPSTIDPVVSLLQILGEARAEYYNDHEAFWYLLGEWDCNLTDDVIALKEFKLAAEKASVDMRVELQRK